jgi:hypothetical protein
VALLTRTLGTVPVGPDQLQAANAAVHDEAPRGAETDWPQILALDQALGIAGAGAGGHPQPGGRGRMVNGPRPPAGRCRRRRRRPPRLPARGPDDHHLPEQRSLTLRAARLS